MNQRKFIVTTLLSVTLTACVNAPQGLQKEHFNLHSLSQVQPSDYQCQCKTIRLGGKILNATALPNQMKLEVLSYPISSVSAKPSLDMPSNGRFITYINGFIDPATLQEQFITVGGRLERREQGKIDQASYTYPVINAHHYRLWQLAQSYYYPHDDWDDWGGFWRPRSAYWFAEPEIRYYLY
ncbi:Slp family lipoprotein [Haemophilus pittmaniae]|nr:Slp family lipoprotein [Haemophilus pittmaniae]